MESLRILNLLLISTYETIYFLNASFSFSPLLWRLEILSKSLIFSYFLESWIFSWLLVSRKWSSLLYYLLKMGTYHPICFIFVCWLWLFWVLSNIQEDAFYVYFFSFYFWSWVIFLQWLSFWCVGWILEGENFAILDLMGPYFVTAKIAQLIISL